MKLLADTTHWINHFRIPNPEMIRLAKAGLLLTHSSIIGELAVGNLKNRLATLFDLFMLPTIEEVNPDLVIAFIEKHKLYGKGLSWIDLQVLAACHASNIPIWTTDKRLLEAAQQFNLAWTPPTSQL